MFGSRKETNQPLNQIPYEVYQTAHEPDVRRRRWFIRLGAALIVVSLLIIGGMQLYGALTKDDPKPAPQSEATKNNGAQATNNGNGAQQQQGGGQSQAPAATAGSVTQSPQQNSPLPASGSGPENGVQTNNSNNTTTVRKPD